MKHGQKILITNKLKRVSKYKRLSKTAIYKAEFKEWKEQEIKEIEVVFLGFRTLSNGQNEYQNEYGNIYHPLEYIKVALVSENLNLNPYYTILNK